MINTWVAIGILLILMCLIGVKIVIDKINLGIIMEENTVMLERIEKLESRVRCLEILYYRDFKLNKIK